MIPEGLSLDVFFPNFMTLFPAPFPATNDDYRTVENEYMSTLVIYTTGKKKHTG